MKADELLHLKVNLNKIGFFGQHNHWITLLILQTLPNYLSLFIFLRMHKLVKPSAEKRYVDLTVSFAPDVDGDEDLPGPPVRYYFSHDTDEQKLS